MTRGQYAANRLFQTLKARSGILRIRMTTQAIGPEPLQNPPRFEICKVVGPHPVGSTTLKVAGSFHGRLIPGDAFYIGFQRVVIPAFKTFIDGEVTLDINPLKKAVEDGEALVPDWVNEDHIPFRVSAFSKRASEGNNILATDLAVMIPNWKLKRAPDTKSRLFFPDSKQLQVVTVMPTFEGAEIVAYTMQARG